MLRIGQPGLPGQPAPPTEDTSMEPEVPETPQDLPELPQPPAGQRYSADKADPTTVRYMSSDMGPFICANCQHFTPEGECNVVSGPIDPEGVCIVFTPMQGGGVEGEAEDVQPVEDMPVDMPTETPEGLNG